MSSPVGEMGLRADTVQTPKSANSLNFKGSSEKIAVISQAIVFLYPVVRLLLLEPLKLDTDTSLQCSLPSGATANDV